MNRRLRGGVILTPHTCRHGATLPIDGHNAKLVSSRTLHRCHFKSKNMSMLPSAFHVDFILVSTANFLFSLIGTYMECDTDGMTRRLHPACCTLDKSRHICSWESKEYLPKVLGLWRYQI
jgi:hypothetical protein